VLLVAIGFTLELLAWASGFGAMLGHAFSGWQARRPHRGLVRPSTP
jgi:predicted small integral membrane protein